MKNDIESLFCDSCNIYEYEKYTEGSVTKHSERLKYTNIKCRISYSTGVLYNRFSSAQEKTDALKSNQTIKLFLPNNITVKAGSKIEVFHQNSRSVFVNCSQQAIYKYHSEVMLDNGKEWA